MTGRPTKLTPATQERILNAIRIGMPLHSAAGLAGIDVSTYHIWMNRGQESKTGIYFDFFNSVKKAEEEAKARLISKIQVASDEHWQAAAWILERRWPDEFGQRLELRGDAKKPIKCQIEWPDDLHAPATSGADKDST